VKREPSGCTPAAYGCALGASIGLWAGVLLFALVDELRRILELRRMLSRIRWW
jgi:hypothetical protein